MDKVSRSPYTYQWFQEQFSKACDKTIQFCQPISPDLFVQKPSKDVWSVAECYNHLVQFGHQYISYINKGLDTASHKLENPDQPFPPKLIWKGVIKLFAPPYKMKMKTVGPFAPKPSTDLKKDQVITDFISLQNLLIEKLETAKAESIDLKNVKTQNPLLTFIKMSLSECFAVVEVHQRRHIWQAEKILNSFDSATHERQIS